MRLVLEPTAWEVSMPEPDPNVIRSRLVALDDQLRQLPSDAFSQKFELQTEGDELRNQLRLLLESELDEASDAWAECTGRKGTHSVNEEERLAHASITKAHSMDSSVIALDTCRSSAGGSESTESRFECTRWSRIDFASIRHPEESAF
jgi:hypothetical protein